MEVFMSISRFLISAAFAAFPALAVAGPSWWGQADIDVGQTQFSNLTGNAVDDVFERSPGSVRLAGKLGADFGAFGVQFDLRASADGVPEYQYTGYNGGGFAAIHATYDISPALTLSAFGGAGRSAPAEYGIRRSADLTFAGLESRYDFGNWMISASYGQFDATDASQTDAFHNGRFVRIGALGDIGSGVLEGSLSAFDGRQDGPNSYPMDGYAWAVSYSQDFANAPFAWSVGLEGGHFANHEGGVDNGAFSSARLTIGMTAWFGSAGLSQSKRRAFDTVDFARVVHGGYFVD
jgi:hypothetical protein